jgi:hypothetical protein
MHCPLSSAARRFLAVAATLLLVAATAWAAMGLADPAAASRQRDLAAALEAAKGDPAILAAVRTRANANRVRRGDALASTFDTVRPIGALTALPAQGDPVRGTFSPVVNWPLVGIHAVLTFDGRVLTYGTSTTGVRTGYFSYDVWDPNVGLGDNAHTTLANATQVDIFCNAQLLLPDGNIEMWGGDVLNPDKGRASLLPNDDSVKFDPLDNSLVRTGKMFRERWYATATTLPNGEVYIQGGTGGEDFPEVRTATGTFRLLGNVATSYLGALYPRNFVAPDGFIFGTRYEELYRVDPMGAGELKRVGKFPPTSMGASSTAVMFRPGRILQLGGGYDTASASPQAYVIDIDPAKPVVRTVASPTQRRHWANSTMLADGRVFVSGGSVADNDPVSGVGYTTELYDPVQDTWSPGATAQRMRLYHSAALLLPDASVLTLGGGANGPELNLNAEVYYPPYLFNADGTPASRPVIASAPMAANPSQTLAIGTPVPASIRRVTLVKTGSVTHSFDMDQRFLELPFSVSGGQLQAELPANPFLTPPGYYLLFVIDDRGVPSEAAIMRINTIDPARITINAVIVNDDGGTSSPVDFSFSADGGTPVPFDADASNTINLVAGTHSITGIGASHYAVSANNCSGLALAAGGSATCTLTFDDIPGFIASAGSSKPVYVPGETVVMTARVFDAGDPVAGVRVNFDALKPNGINHVYGTATTDANGNASASFVSGTGSSSIGTYQLTATVTSGNRTTHANATFDVIKPQPATLRVMKLMVNENGGTAVASDFSFSVNGGTPIRFEADGSNVLTVAAGTYTVTEPPSPGYSASLVNCSNLVLAAGESATCTITNADLPPPSFSATAGTTKAVYAPAETVTMTARVLNNGNPVAGARVSFDALKPNNVNHIVLLATTDANGNASASFVAGGGPSSLGTYQLTASVTSGSLSTTATATFQVLQSAAPPATLNVNAVVVNDNGGTRGPAGFSFSVNGAAAMAFEADGTNSLSVPAGSYSITSPAVAGYAASASNCTGLNLASGGSATCTFTYDDVADVSLSVSTEPSKATYIRGETVVLRATVLRNGSPLQGAQVNFNALKPNQVNRVILNATSDASGVATVSFVSGTGPSSIGTYQLTVTATSGGQSAQATSTFVVQ